MAVPAWYGVLLLNVRARRAVHSVRNVDQYRLPGVQPPNQNCRRDVVCAGVIGLPFEIALVPYNTKLSEKTSISPLHSRHVYDDIDDSL